MMLVDLGTAVVGAVVFAGLVVSLIEIERRKHRAEVYKHLLKQYTIHTAFGDTPLCGDVSITAKFSGADSQHVYQVALIRKDGFKDLLSFPVVTAVKALLIEEVNIKGNPNVLGRLAGKLTHVQYSEEPIKY